MQKTLGKSPPNQGCQRALHFSVGLSGVSFVKCRSSGGVKDKKPDVGQPDSLTMSLFTG